MSIYDVYRDSGEVDERAIYGFEEYFGVKLPPSYKSLLSAHDAPVLKKNIFSYYLSGKKLSSDVVFLGFGKDLKSYKSIFRFQKNNEPRGGGVIVFGCAANGDYICFDYRSDPASEEPQVVIMLHDYTDENNNMLVCPVADSFDQFIGLLYSESAE
jgi:cell wall assembly regulator SMI1